MRNGVHIRSSVGINITRIDTSKLFSFENNCRGEIQLLLKRLTALYLYLTILYLTLFGGKSSSLVLTDVPLLTIYYLVIWCGECS